MDAKEFSDAVNDSWRMLFALGYPDNSFYGPSKEEEISSTCEKLDDAFDEIEEAWMVHADRFSAAIPPVMLEYQMPHHKAIWTSAHEAVMDIYASWIANYGMEDQRTNATSYYNFPDTGDAIWDFDFYISAWLDKERAVLGLGGRREKIKRTPRSDEPTAAELERGRTVLNGMGVRKPTKEAFRSAYRAAGFTGRNGKLNKIFDRLREE